MPAKSLSQNTWGNKVDSLYIHLHLEDELDFDIFLRDIRGDEEI
jgi:hypothetical protein